MWDRVELVHHKSIVGFFMTYTYKIDMKPTIPIQKPGALPVSIDQWLRSWPKFTKVHQSWLQRALKPLKPTMLQQLLVCWGCFRHSHRDVGHSLHKSRDRRGCWDGGTDAIPKSPRKICLETKSHWEYPILTNIIQCSTLEIPFHF